MIFEQGLNEYSNDIPLNKWNAIQKVLWQDVCKDLKLDINNTGMFAKFARFFDEYYKANKKFPSAGDVEDVVVNESLFVRTGGHRHEIHTEKRSKFSDKKLDKKNKKTAPKVQKDDIHLKAYRKAVKNNSQYSIWMNDTVSKI